MEPSTLVSTTGTTTSIHERGPRGFHPRSRCASVTWTKDVATEGTRLSDAAMATPVRDRPPGGNHVRSHPERAAESRPRRSFRAVARGRVADVGRSGLLAYGSPPPAHLPEAFTSVAFVGRGLPAHSCATAPASHRIPLVPSGTLAWA